MSESISFSIQNPEDTTQQKVPVIFTGQANTLDFNLGFPGALTPSDTLTFKLPQSLLQAVTPEQITSPDWDIASVPDPTDVYFIFSLRPKSNTGQQVQITFDNLQATDAGRNAPVYVDCRINGMNLPGLHAQLSVQNPPVTTNQDLQDVLAFNLYINELADSGACHPANAAEGVYLSDPQLAAPISNRIHLNMKCSPEFVSPDNWPSGTPMFTLNFSYGAKSYDLTDDTPAPTDKARAPTDTPPPPQYNKYTSAYNIEGSVEDDENTLWEISQVNSSGPAWQIIPQKSTNLGLFAGDRNNLDVWFSHVITIVAGDNATLYVQWTNIPGYNDYIIALNIPKLPAPDAQILYFSCTNPDSDFKDLTSIDLQYCTFGASSLHLYWDRKHRSKPNIALFDQQTPHLAYSGTISIPKSDIDNQTTHFLLAACDAVGNETGVNGSLSVTVTDFPAPSVQSFEGWIVADENGDISGAAYSWLVDDLGDDGTIFIQGIQMTGYYNGVAGDNKKDPIPADGSTPLNRNVMLTATNPDTDQGVATEPFTLLLDAKLVPKITNLKGVIERDGNGNATNVVLSWNVKNALFRGDLQNPSDVLWDTYCTVNGEGNYTPDIKNGSVTVTFPVSAASPLLSKYLVQVNNPNNSSQKTLKVSFSVANQISMPATSIFTNVALNGAGNTGVATLSLNEGGYCVVTFDTNNPADLTMLNPRFDNDNMNGLCFSPDSDGDDQQIYFAYDQLSVYPSHNPVNYFNLILMINDPYGIVFSASSDPSKRLTWLGTGQQIVYFPRNNFVYPPIPPIVPTYIEVQTILYQSNPNWAQNMQVSGLAITPDGKRIFVADRNNGFVFYFDTDNVPAVINGPGTPEPIMASNQVQSICMSTGGYAYWVGARNQNDPPNTMLLHSLQIDGPDYRYHPWITVPCTKDQILMYAVAASNYVLVANPGDDQILVVAGAPFDLDTPEANILQTIPISVPWSIAIMPDNSRFFVTNDNLIVFEAELVVA